MLESELISSIFQLSSTNVEIVIGLIFLFYFRTHGEKLKNLDHNINNSKPHEKSIRQYMRDIEKKITSIQKEVTENTVQTKEIKERFIRVEKRADEKIKRLNDRVDKIKEENKNGIK